MIFYRAQSKKKWTKNNNSKICNRFNNTKIKYYNHSLDNKLNYNKRINIKKKYKKSKYNNYKIK